MHIFLLAEVGGRVYFNARLRQLIDQGVRNQASRQGGLRHKLGPRTPDPTPEWVQTVNLDVQDLGELVPNNEQP